MLRLTAFEFIFRVTPESFAIMLIMITLCEIKLNVKRYIISSSLLAVYVYYGRMLPIDYGVHTILDIFIMIIIVCSINNSDVILAIKASLITTISLFIVEEINMLTLSIIFKDKLEMILSNAMLKTVYGLPSLILFLIIAITFYLKKKDLKYVKS